MATTATETRYKPLQAYFHDILRQLYGLHTKLNAGHKFNELDIIPERSRENIIKKGIYVVLSDYAEAYFPKGDLHDVLMEVEGASHDEVLMIVEQYNSIVRRLREKEAHLKVDQ